MIYFFKKYLKYFIIVFIGIFVLVGSFYYENSTVETSEVKKLSVTKKNKVEEKNSNNIDVKTVFVDVKGAVNNPGVYEMDSEKRIIDAINLAGGLTDNANTINLNLSKKVVDEMYIVVYNQKQIDDYKKDDTNNISCAAKECVCPDINNGACISTESENNKKNNINKISINNASLEELMTLSGIGEAKALAIIAYRENNNGFKNIEEILNVSGIGNSLYEKIKNNIIL